LISLPYTIYDTLYYLPKPIILIVILPNKIRVSRVLSSLKIELEVILYRSSLLAYSIYSNRVSLLLISKLTNLG
jgi:hypothetical protein